MLGRLQRIPPIYTGAIMGLAIGALFCLLHYTPVLRPLERVCYDGRFRLLKRPALASPDVVVIGLDNASFELPEMTENFGRWPWHRKLYAQLLWYLRQAPARAVGIDVTFAGRDSDAESDALFQQLLGEAKDTVLAFTLNDSRIEWTAAAQSGNDPALQKSAWQVENAGCAGIADYSGIEISLSDLTAAARALGCITFDPDPDGVRRRLPIFYRYRDRYYPALSLALAAPSLGAAGPVARFDCRGNLDVGQRRIPLVPGSPTTLIYWYGPYGEAFRHFPVWQVFDSARALDSGGKPAVALSEFRDKIVLIGPTAPGIGDLHPTPFSPVYPGVDVHATMISNLLQGHFVSPITPALSLAIIMLMSLLTSVAVWHFNRWPAYTAVTLGLLAGFIGLNFGLFWSARISLLMAAPAAAAATAFAAGNLGRYVTEGREKRRYRSTLMKYVAPTIVEAMMQDRRLAELHNEKRELTVLFSDVRGFTSLSEKLAVAELVKTLNEFLNGMVTVIFANGGTLDKFVGDCVMAFWGAPIPQENHAELAARSALEMQAALERLNQKWRAQGRPELKIGVGINTGEMIFGNIGSQQRMDFTVIGDNVNLASRLESSTKELKASIVISDATYQRIKHLAEVRDLGTIHVKGKEVGIRVYELLGMRREENSSYASAQG